jgi:hypothetical protein
MADFLIAAGAAASVVLLIVTRVRAILHKGTCGFCTKCGYCTGKLSRSKNTKYMDNDCN